MILDCDRGWFPSDIKGSRRAPDARPERNVGGTRQRMGSDNHGTIETYRLYSKEREKLSDAWAKFTQAFSPKSFLKKPQ